MIVKGGFVHVAFALIKRITIVTTNCEKSAEPIVVKKSL